MLFKDPENFQDFLKPVAGDILIRPAAGRTFNTEICIKKLQHIDFFSLSSNSFKAFKEPQNNFIGITIPLNAPFTITLPGRQQVYESSLAHMLLPDRDFDLSAKKKCHFMVSNINVDSFNEYSKKLLQSYFQELSSKNSDIQLFTKEGGALLRAIAQAWSSLNKKLSTSEILLKELEDDIFASLVLYLNKDATVTKDYYRNDQFILSRAEEYINENLKQPITRDQLTDVSCRSIRTISRAFEKKYGFGPMTFIKQRRLDSAYLELLSLNPDATTVSKIALEYGFGHAGKFAIEYKKTFGESPSTTLVKY